MLCRYTSRIHHTAFSSYAMFRTTLCLLLTLCAPHVLIPPYALLNDTFGPHPSLLSSPLMSSLLSLLPSFFLSFHHLSPTLSSPPFLLSFLPSHPLLHSILLPSSLSQGNVTTISLDTAAGAQALETLAEGIPARDRERESMSSQGTYSTISSSLSLAFNSHGVPQAVTSAQLSSMQMNNHGSSSVSSITGMQVQYITVQYRPYVLTTHVLLPFPITLFLPCILPSSVHFIPFPSPSFALCSSPVPTPHLSPSSSHTLPLTLLPPHTPL